MEPRVYRVQKSKKNKGKKRVWWQHEVKAYHAGQGKGSGKSSKGLDQEVGAGYPDAPWWKPPTEEEKEEEDKQKEDEVEFVEPLVKKPKNLGVRGRRLGILESSRLTREPGS